MQTIIEATSVFDGMTPPNRASGRRCVECGAKLCSYSVQRVRCGPCDDRRIDAEAEIAALWQRFEERMAQMRCNRDRGKLNREMVARAVAELSSPRRGGFLGDHLTLTEILPMNRVKIRDTWLHLVRLGCLRNDGGIWKLVRMPYNPA